MISCKRENKEKSCLTKTQWKWQNRISDVMAKADENFQVSKIFPFFLMTGT